MSKQPTVDKYAKVRRYQKVAKKVSQRDDGGRIWSALEDKYEQELRAELDPQVEFDKLVRQRAKNELNSLRKIGETEAFGIITIAPVFNIEYYPLLLLKDEDGIGWELREAPLRLITLWVKQLASDIKEVQADLDQYVDTAAKTIAEMTAFLKAIRALERLLKKWINQERSNDRPESQLHFGNFLSETGRMNPLKDPPRKGPPHKYPPHDEDGVVIEN